MLLRACSQTQPGTHTPYLFPHLSSTYISAKRSTEVVGNTVCRRSQMCIHACRGLALNNFLKTQRCWEDSFAWKLLWCISLLVLPNYYSSTRCNGLVFNAISEWHSYVNDLASHLGHIYLGWLNEACSVYGGLRVQRSLTECRVSECNLETSTVGIILRWVIPVVLSRYKYVKKILFFVQLQNTTKHKTKFITTLQQHVSA